MTHEQLLPFDPLAEITPEDISAIVSGQLVVVEDPPGGEAEHVTAYTADDAGYGINDIVRIQEGNDVWMGTIVTRNRNRGRLSGDRFEAIKLTAYDLPNPDGTAAVAAEYLRVWEIRLLGCWEHERVTFHFTRPGPGARGQRVTADLEQTILRLPQLETRSDGTTNVIGGIQRRGDLIAVPVAAWQLVWHFLLAGATGGGKTSAIANLAMQATKFACASCSTT